MFAVAGTWSLNLAHSELQADQLTPLVARVAQNPGFVRGYWTQAVEDPSVNLTFIVFDTLDQANAFRDAVIANAPAQAEAGVELVGLRLVEVTGQA